MHSHMNLLKRIKPDSLDRLEILLRYENYQKAAERINITPKGLKKNIKEMESALGMFLVNSHATRSKRNGKLVISPEARQLVAMWQKVRPQMLHTLERDILLPQELDTILRVGCQHGHWYNLVEQVAEQLFLNQPRVRLELSTTKTALLLEQMRRDQLDVALIYDHKQPVGQTDIKHIGAQTLRLYYSYSPPQDAADLLQHFVFIDWGERINEIVYTQLCERNGGRMPPYRISFDTGQTAIAHCRRHRSFAWFPDTMIEQHNLHNHLHPVPDTEPLERNIYLLAEASVLQDQAETPQLEAPLQLHWHACREFCIRIQERVARLGH